MVLLILKKTQDSPLTNDRGCLFRCLKIVLWLFLNWPESLYAQPDKVKQKSSQHSGNECPLIMKITFCEIVNRSRYKAEYKKESNQWHY